MVWWVRCAGRSSDSSTLPIALGSNGASNNPKRTGGGEAVVREGEEVGAEVPGPLREGHRHEEEREARLCVFGEICGCEKG